MFEMIAVPTNTTACKKAAREQSSGVFTNTNMSGNSVNFDNVFITEKKRISHVTEQTKRERT
jgi:hypothetical protein